MKTISTLIATAALMAANSANAQSSTSSPAGSFSTDGYYIYGYVDLTYFDSDGLNETFARADVDMGILPAVGISGVPIGFSLGIDAFSADFANEIALYPALTYALGNSLISVGAPRSVYDKGYIPHYDFGGSSPVDLELKLSLITGSALASFYLQGSDTPLGLRYDGEFGNTKVGASYHRIDDSIGNLDFYAIAFQHKLAALSSFFDVLFFGGFEHISDGGSNATAYALGAEGGANRLHAGIVLERTDIMGDVDTTNLYVDYKITDSFSANASVARISIPGPTANIYGVGLEYNFLNNGYVRANYTNADNLFFDELYEISVGWKF